MTKPGYNRFIFAITGSFFFLFVNHAVFAQENNRLERISVKEGLSQSDVKCMIQDRFGFLWIGTRDGLNKYDGQSFRRFVANKGDKTSLIFNAISDLELDSIGNVWIGTTEGVGYYDYRIDAFFNYPLDQDKESFTEINDVFIDGNARLVLSTNNGLMVFDITTKKYQYVEMYEEFKGKNLTQFHSSMQYGLWIATEDGLYHKMHYADPWSKFLDGSLINDINLDDDNIYISSEDGLYRYELGTRRLKKISLPTMNANVAQTLRAKDGTLWVACNNVVVLGRNDQTVIREFSYKHDDGFSLSENRAQALFQTSDSVIWIGTLGYGLNKYNPDISKFQYLGEQGSIKLSANYITSIYSNDDNLLLIGTFRGLNVVNQRDLSLKKFLNNELIHDLKGEKDGSAWISSVSGFYKYINGHLMRSRFPWEIYDMVDWDTSTLLLGTVKNGLYLFNKTLDSYSLLVAQEKLPGVVLALWLTNDAVWVGGDKGLSIFTRQGDLIKHFRSSANLNSLPSDIIKCLFFDASNTLWLGTWGGGISKFNAVDSTFKTYDQSDGLPSNVVYGIIDDWQGNLWLSTNRGIAAFDPLNGTFRNFDFADGLQGDEFNTGAYFESKSEIIYFGGTDGLTIFNPKHILALKHAPEVLMTDILIGNTSYKDLPNYSTDGIHFIRQLESNWQENNFTLTFTAVDFKNAGKLLFQYAINDTTWYDIGNRRNLELVNLSSGNHEVLIRARSLGSSWSISPLKLSINIAPPFWRRTDLIVAAIGLIIGGIYLAYRVRTNFLEKVNIKLNEQVTKRTKEVLIKNERLINSSQLLAEKNKLLEEQGQVLKDLSQDLERKLTNAQKTSNCLIKIFVNSMYSLRSFHLLQPIIFADQ